jgi:hypothetical protein
LPLFTAVATSALTSEPAAGSVNAKALIPASSIGLQKRRF